MLNGWKRLFLWFIRNEISLCKVIQYKLQNLFNMKYFLYLFITIFMISCGQQAAQKKVSSEEAKKPNVLLLVGDDIAFGDLGVYGSEINTTNIDRLEQAGVRFSNFHASPVCSVTRSMLLTGCNNIEVGLGSFDYSSCFQHTLIPVIAIRTYTGQ